MQQSVLVGRNVLMLAGVEIEEQFIANSSEAGG
jgi:hypothetical protein